MTNIQQGGTNTTRDGSKVKLTSILINIFAEVNATAGANALRVMLVHDKQTNQAIYSLSDLLDDSSVTDNLVSPLNTDNGFRFRVLWNRKITLDQDGSTSKKFLKFYRKLNMRMRFDGSTPSIADITSGSLSLVFIANASTNGPTVAYNSRIRFVDN